MSVLERFRALAGRRAPVDAGCGVVTAVDADYFPGLQILWAGCREHAPLAVVDLGMRPEQRSWCAGRVQVLEMPTLLVPRIVPMWQTWNKCCYVRISPFARTLWLDADCIVVGDLRPLFARIGRGPFGIVEPFLSRVWLNKDDVYRRYPVPAQIPQQRTVNGGVLGFGDNQRSQELLSVWAEITAEVGNEPGLADWFAYWDQGTLHWAVEKLDFPQVAVEERGWNRFCLLPGRGGPAAFLERLTIKPGDVVLHLMIRPKPWRAWGDLEAEPVSLDGAPGATGGSQNPSPVADAPGPPPG